jgi:thioredoxin reductase
VAAVEQPYPPGEYDVVVVGSGPGGLQTSYCLRRFDVPHALLSADDEPAGMFRRWPVFQRLISWSKLDAPASPESAEYERYDHNSLVADEPEHRALVPAAMGRESVFPTRAEMESGIRAFAERTGLAVQYGCSWLSTSVDEQGFALATTDGEYRCRFLVLAVGMTEPWKPELPGISAVPHYAETGSAEEYRDRTVVLIGKRNSGFELADGLLPWARRIVLVSPRAVETAVLAHATVRPRYFQPLEEQQIGGGTFAVDAAVDSIEQTAAGGFRVSVSGTRWPGRMVLEADRAIAATGFRVPLRDLPRLGLLMVEGNRVPALSAYWESVSLPGVFFAGNATVGAAGLRRHGVGAASTSVRGFRYNARVLARHIAERLGAVQPYARPLSEDEVPELIAGELRRCADLWGQKAYLARVVELERGGHAVDRGVQPLWYFVDEPRPDAVAVTIETDRDGVTFPGVYLRRGGRIREERLDPQPLNEFDSEPYRRAVAALIRTRPRPHADRPG